VKLPEDERRYFFLDLEDKIKFHPSSAIAAKKIGPAAYGLGHAIGLASHAKVIEEVLQPFRS
jgi:hypothetical protein